MRKKNTSNFKKNKLIIAGLDEVGRGPLAGPLIACAYIQIEEVSDVKITDSKKMNESQREVAFDRLIANGYYGLGQVEAEEIDQIGLGKANLLAFRRAIDNLPVRPDLVMIDGNYKIDPSVTNQIPFQTLIQGDSLVKEISCASIIAKVTRDRLMAKYHKKFPKYQFDQHKGYGTAVHLHAIKKHGVCKLHRRSFKPVQDLLKPLQLNFSL